MHPQKFDRALLGIARAYAGELARLRNKYIRRVAQEYSVYGAHNSLAFTQYQIDLETLWKRRAKATIRFFGKQTKVIDNKKNRVFTGLQVKEFSMPKSDNLFWNLHYLNFAERFGGAKVKDIAETTREDIIKAISQDLPEPISINDAKKKVKAVTAFSAYRSATIALTETHNAAMFASYETAQDITEEFQIKALKRWVPVTDERTREDHRAMADHPAIELDELFQVGDALMDRPGDPAGGPDQCIRCRCALIYETE